MKTLNPYITFSGNCREAMEFYQECLGGELHFQTMGESLFLKNTPGKMKKLIVHAVLDCENFVLMGSDMVDDIGLVKGNTVSIVLHCTTEKEIRSCYKKLSEDGKPTHPLAITFWGTLFGCLTDRYGNLWMLSYSKKTKNEKAKITNADIS
jgi:PhnB protein